MKDEVIHSEWRPSCLGGWCSRRDRCRHYAEVRRVIVERMCERGTTDHFAPIPGFAALERSVAAAAETAQETLL